MDYYNKIELAGLAKNALKQSFKENGIDNEFIGMINPNAESPKDLDIDDLCMIMYIEGYLRCKQDNLSWTYFKDEMPKEDGYYLIKMENEPPFVGYLTIESSGMYSVDYAHKKQNSVQYESRGAYFDKHILGRMIAWISTKELYKE